MAVQEKFDLVIRAKDEATATLQKVNREVNSLGTSGVPRLTGSMSNYTKEAIKADLKSAALGTRLAGLSPAVGQLSSAFAFGNPLVAAAAFGMGLLSSEIVNTITAHQQATEAVFKHRTEIELLANSNSRYAETARQLLGIVKSEEEQDLRVAKGKLALAQQGMRAANFYERLIGLGPLVKASQDDVTKASAEAAGEIARLEKSLGLLSNQMYGPTRDDFERFIAQEKQAAKDADMLNKALRQQATLLQGLKPGEFRGSGSEQLGGAGQFSPFVPEVEREPDMSVFESVYGKNWRSDFTSDVREAEDQYREFQGMVLSSTDQLATGITDMFFGMRDSLADVFKSMAANWVRYFINEILKQTALRLGLQLFGVLFPGSGNLIGAAGDTTSQGFSLAAGKVSPAGTGLDIASSGAKRFAPSGGTGASVTVQINGDVIGDESFVNKRLIPAIEKAARLQLTRIQVA